MELSEKFLDATWTKDINGKPKFFIINEAIIAKLCVLGEEQEPCFEGSTITQPTLQFSFDEDFKEQIFSMMKELKDLIKEGGTPVFNEFAVEIGGALWDALYTYLEKTFPRDLEEGECDCYRCSKYGIDSIWEEGEQKFVILTERASGKLYRLNFMYDEDGISTTGEMTEVEKTYVPVRENPTFALEEVEDYEQKRYSSQGNSEQTITDKIDTIVEDENSFAKKDEDEEEETCPDCGKPKSECKCEKDDEEEKEKKAKYSLEDIPEYVELLEKYSTLENEFSALRATKEELEGQIVELNAFKEELMAFKHEIEIKEKQAMIDGFYMLSDEDKKEVIDNIETYSLDDIEAKLSIICVRNKVSFNLEGEKEAEPTVYSLNDTESVPAWIKSLQSVAKDINN